MVYQRKEYEWKHFQYSVNPNVVGGVIESIEERDGTVTPKALVDEARAENSPIHSMFTWNNEIAAERYRQQEARNVINCLSVKIIKSEDTPKIYKAFVNVSEHKNEGTYINVTDAFDDDRTRAIVLNRALKELESFANKYQSLEELQEVFTAINDVKEKIA